MRQHKYKLLLLGVLGLLLCDMVYHKGMLRIILPKKFPVLQNTRISPLPFNTLIPTGKDWIKAVDDRNTLQLLPLTVEGIEADVYFEPAINGFEVHHDPVATIHLRLDTLLQDYSNRRLKAGIWLDFKNLDSNNLQPALIEIIRLRKRFNLENKIIVESPSADCLQAFSNEKIFTSYYTPFFNPYLLSDKELLHYADSMRTELMQHPVNALSGYYYQYPFLKKYFPGFPILTWADHASYSVVGYFFKRKLANDTAIKIVLRPFRK